MINRIHYIQTVVSKLIGIAAMHMDSTRYAGNSFKFQGLITAEQSPSDIEINCDRGWALTTRLVLNNVTSIIWNRTDTPAIKQNFLAKLTSGGSGCLWPRWVFFWA